MGYISRYIRERYVRRNIRRDLYERLVRWCGERSVNLCLEKALSILEANIASNIAPNIATVTSANKPATLAPNIASNIAPNMGASTGTGQPEPATSTSGGYEWCRSKARVRSLQSFIKWVDEHLGLLDWWDEDDKYCFKTKKKGASRDRGDARTMPLVRRRSRVQTPATAPHDKSYQSPGMMP
jgi:hypothetical protein